MKKAYETVGRRAGIRTGLTGKADILQVGDGSFFINAIRADVLYMECVHHSHRNSGRTEQLDFFSSGSKMNKAGKLLH